MMLAHHMPEDTFEWRAAEYGLDPDTQFDEIVRIVLAEPHLPVAAEGPATQASAAVWAAPEVEVAIGDAGTAEARAALIAELPAPPVAPLDPVSLFNAPCIDTAREWHCARLDARLGPDGAVAGVPGRPPHTAVDGIEATVLLDSGDGDPLDTLRAEAPMCRDRLAVKAQHVARLRDNFQAARLAASPKPARPRRRPMETAAELAARLFPSNDPEGT